MGDNMTVSGGSTQGYVVPTEVREVPKKGQGALGTIACDGKGNLGVKNYAKPIDRFCVDVHEGLHRQDWLNRYGPDVCKNVPANQLPTGGPGYTEFQKDSECRAHMASYKCSDPKLKDTEAKLAAAEEKLKGAKGKDAVATKQEVNQLKKDRDDYLRFMDNGAVNMLWVYHCKP